MLILTPAIRRSRRRPRTSSPRRAARVCRSRPSSRITGTARYTWTWGQEGARAGRSCSPGLGAVGALKNGRIRTQSTGKIRASTLVDLFVGFDWGRYSVELFATNVFDKRNQLSRFGLRPLRRAGASRATRSTSPEHRSGHGRARSASGWERSSSDRARRSPASLHAARSSCSPRSGWPCPGGRRRARPRDLRGALRRAAARLLALRHASSPRSASRPSWSARGFIAAAWLWWAGHRRLRVVLLLVILVGRGLERSSRNTEIARVGPTLEPHLVVVRTSSFPSGHATSSMIFYLTLALALDGGDRWHRPAVARRDPAVAG